MSPVWTMPDGSRWNIPDVEVWSPSVPASPKEHMTPSTTVAPEAAQRFLREIGRRGGQARAARHSREEIAEWGRRRHKPRSRV